MAYPDEVHPDQDYYRQSAYVYAPPPTTSARPSMRRTNPTVGLFLALLPGFVFLFGVGHVYAGKWVRGLAYLLLFWVTAVTTGAWALLLWPVLLIWTPLDAYRLVDRRRRRALSA